MHERVAFLFIITFQLILASPRIKLKSSNNQKGLPENTKTNVRQDSNSDSKKFDEDDDDFGNPNGCYDIDSENKSINNGENAEQLKDEDGAFSSEDGKDNYPSERSLRAGDIFTAQELLPVTKKYLRKINVPGAGKGIVSSAKSPEALADTIFTAFFDTSKRIVVLEEGDLPGLDAFQALAVDGEAVDLRTNNAKSYTERPYQQVNSQGEMTILRSAPGKCHYRLISKKVKESETVDSRRGQGIEIAKNLEKKRHLIVNVGHRPKGNVAKKSFWEIKTKDKNTSRKVNKTKACKNKKKRDKFSNLRSSKKDNLQNNTQKTVCHWKYQCKTITNLDTCRLHKVCAPDGRAKSAHNSKDVIITHEDEQRLFVTQFRKMLGITVLDEEVEKIIQSRLLRRRGNYFGGEMEIIQSLEEYFNGIVMAEYLSNSLPEINPSRGTTTPVSPTNDSSQSDQDQQADLDNFSNNE